MPPIRNLRTYHCIVLVLVILFTALSAFKIKDLQFAYDFEAYFPNEDNELEIYNAYRKTFEYDNEFVLIALENKKGIFKKDFLSRVDSLTAELATLRFIQQVTSPTNLKVMDIGGFIPVQRRVLHFEDQTFYKEDSLRIFSNDQLPGSYFGTDAKSISLYIKTNDVLTKKQSDELADRIDAVVKEYRFDDVHIVGRIFAQKFYLSSIQREFFLFLLISFFVVLVFLWFTFRSLYGVVVPVLVVLVAILWTLGIMELLGKSIDIMAIMLPTMVFIAGMSDVIHFFSKYFDELNKSTAREKIYPLILKEVGFPTFLTLLTTVVGFLSLLFSSIQPVREFGIYTSVGVVMAFILTYTLLPALLYFFNPGKLIKVQATKTRTFRGMRTGLFWIFRHQALILVISALVIGISVYGMTRIRVNNILLEDLNDRVRLKQDFLFFDKYYSGVRPLEIHVKLKDSTLTVWDYEVIRELCKVEAYIRHEYGAGFIISPASLVRSTYAGYTGDARGYPDWEDYKKIKKMFEGLKNSPQIKKLVTPDGMQTRISAKTRDIGSSEINRHNQNLLNFIGRKVDSNLLSFEITGAAHLIDRNNEYMVSNMTQGFLFSLLIIGLLTFFLHRSWKMVLVFIIPNALPLLAIAGIMGFAGIELKAATSLVFSIAFGIATDDTIHFISRLKIELAYGKSLLYAFKRTYFETGKPIILTTLILLGGFMSLLFSNFESTFYFGLLICLTVIIAVIADLFLLPVLLFLLYRKK